LSRACRPEPRPTSTALEAAIPATGVSCAAAGARIGASAGAPRVLVVDDQPVFRQAARLLLERRGYPVVAEASCALTALDAVGRFAPDAVLLDVRLGDDDGIEVCRTLMRARPGLAVLLTSSVEHDPGDDLVVSSGARGFISKARLLDADFGHFWRQRAAEQASDPDQLRLMKQIHDEAELLRVVAHEADVEMAAISAATRRKREVERLRRYAARFPRRKGESGEDR
jgi:DNA-binding NarL/FixJ family response regulator